MKLLVVALLFFVLSAQAVNADELILSVHPFLPANEVKTRFSPLADYLAEQIGIKVTVRVGAGMTNTYRQ